MRKLKAILVILVIWAGLSSSSAITRADILSYIRDWPTNPNGRIWGIAIGPNGNVYVTDQQTDSVTVYSPFGQRLWSWGGTDTTDGHFIGARGICVNPSNGDVYVSENRDIGRDRVQRFNSDGTFVGSWSSANGYSLSGPFGLTIGSDGNLWVADMYNSRVCVFTPDGTFLTAWGGYGAADSQLVNPIGIVTEGTDVYLADYARPLAQRFTTAGLHTWTQSSGSTNLYAYFGGVSQNPVDHNLYLTEWGANRIYSLNTSGTWLGTYGQWGVEPGMLWEPKGIACAPNGLIFVVDSGNHRIQVFAPYTLLGVEPMDDTFQLGVTPNPGRKPVVRFSIGHSSLVNLSVYDVSGRRISTLVNGPLGPGTHTRSWGGVSTQPGVYFIRLSVGPETKTIRGVLLQ